MLASVLCIFKTQAVVRERLRVCHCVMCKASTVIEKPRSVLTIPTLGSTLAHHKGMVGASLQACLHSGAGVLAPCRWLKLPCCSPQPCAICSCAETQRQERIHISLFARRPLCSYGLVLTLYRTIRIAQLPAPTGGGLCQRKGPRAAACCSCRGVGGATSSGSSPLQTLMMMPKILFVISLYLQAARGSTQAVMHFALACRLC